MEPRKTTFPPLLTWRRSFRPRIRPSSSSLQDADTTTLAVEVTQASTAIDAAMSAEAHKPTGSLFDYLPVS